jgi:hypothetical protein
LLIPRLVTWYQSRLRLGFLKSSSRRRGLPPAAVAALPPDLHLPPGCRRSRVPPGCRRGRGFSFSRRHRFSSRQPSTPRTRRALLPSAREVPHVRRRPLRARCRTLLPSVVDPARSPCAPLLRSGRPCARGAARSPGSAARGRYWVVLASLRAARSPDPATPAPSPGPVAPAREAPRTHQNRPPATPLLRSGCPQARVLCSPAACWDVADPSPRRRRSLPCADPSASCPLHQPCADLSAAPTRSPRPDLIRRRGHLRSVQN